MIRIGQGFDVHRLVEGRRLILGGVPIPSAKGLLGHSDADVLLHAVADAILGAVAAGDIGGWFPPDDETYRDADSRELLRRIMRSDALNGWRVVNLDTTVVAEAPRLAPFILPMRESLAELLGVGIDQVAVKATTTERLGATGRGEGIAALAVVLLGAVGKDGQRSR